MKNWDWKTIFSGHYRSRFNYCEVIDLRSYQIRRKKRKITAITPFKVSKVGINRKPVCDFLLVINSNYHPISYRFEVIADYCSSFGHCVFEPPFGGLGATYDVHLRLIDNLPTRHLKFHITVKVFIEEFRYTPKRTL